MSDSKMISSHIVPVEAHLATAINSLQTVQNSLAAAQVDLSVISSLTHSSHTISDADGTIRIELRDSVLSFYTPEGVLLFSSGPEGLIPGDALKRELNTARKLLSCIHAAKVYLGE